MPLVKRRSSAGVTPNHKKSLDSFEFQTTSEDTDTMMQTDTAITEPKKSSSTKRKPEASHLSAVDTDTLEEPAPLALDDGDDDDDLQRLMLALKKAGNAKSKKRREKFNMITKELQNQFEDFVCKQKEKFDKDWDAQVEAQKKEIATLESEMKSWQNEVTKLVTAYQTHVQAISRGHSRIMKKLQTAIGGATEKDELRMRYSQALQSMVAEGKKIITNMQVQMSQVKVD